MSTHVKYDFLGNSQLPMAYAEAYEVAGKLAKRALLMACFTTGLCLRHASTTQTLVASANGDRLNKDFS